MLVKDIAERKEFKSVTGETGFERAVTAGFVGDLLSVVMGKAKEGSVWTTIQGHMNIVAVATLVGIPCVIVSEAFEVEEDTINKAIEEDICILTTDLSSYDTVSILKDMGI